jgi:hypothetical protein
MPPEKEMASDMDYDTRIFRKEIKENRFCIDSMVIMVKLFFKLYEINSGLHKHKNKFYHKYAAICHGHENLPLKFVVIDLQKF